MWPRLVRKLTSAGTAQRRLPSRRKFEQIETLESRLLLSSNSVAFVDDPLVVNRLVVNHLGKGGMKTPTLVASSESVTYTEDGGAVTLFNSKIKVKGLSKSAIADSQLAFAVTTNGNEFDQLEIISQSPGKKRITTSGTTISYSGSVIGTISGGDAGNPLVITLTTGASKAALQSLWQTVAYRTLDENPSVLSRNISATLTTGLGAESNTLSRTLQIRTINDAPVLRQIGDRIVSSGRGTETIQLMATDEDSSVQFRYEILNAPTELPGRVELNGDILTLTAEAGQQGTLQVRVVASDGENDVSTTFQVHFNQAQVDGIAIPESLLPQWLAFGSEYGLGKPTGEATYSSEGVTTQTYEKGDITWSNDEGYVITDTSVTKALSTPPSTNTGPHTRRPTLLVLTQGAANSGHFTYPWQYSLEAQVRSGLEAAGGQVYTMYVEWDTHAPNDVGVERVARIIESWLGRRDQAWDVMLFGHSRGGIFNQELAEEIGDSPKINILQHIMLDPTASVPQGDQYPLGVPAGVDRAVVYDDGYVFLPLLVRDGLPVSGAAYQRVSIPGIGYQDTATSHNELPEWYAENEFRTDLDWMLGQKPVIASAPFMHEDLGAEFQTIVAAGPEDPGYVLDMGINPNENGNFHGWITIAPIGGADVTIGKSGLNASAGVAVYGSAGVSMTDEGWTVNISAYNFVNGSVIIGADETRVDVSVLGMHVSLFGKDAGFFVGGKKVTIDRDFSNMSGSITVNTTRATETITEVFQDGMKTVKEVLSNTGDYVAERWDTFGNYVSERRDALGNYITERWDAAQNYILETGDQFGKTLVETRDHLGRVLSKGWKDSGKWVSQAFDDLGNLLEERRYLAGFGSTLQQWISWNAAGQRLNVEEFDTLGRKIVDQWLDSSGKWISQQFDAAGKVLQEWKYWGGYGSKLSGWKSWKADGTFTGLEEFNSAGKKIVDQWLDSGGKWISQTLDGAGKVLQEWKYWGGYGSRLNLWRSWRSDGVITGLEEFTSAGKKIADKWLNSAGKWISQELDGAGNVLKQWIYYGVSGTQLHEWATWTAAGKLTNFERYASDGKKTLDAYISTAGDWVERYYSNGVEYSVKFWNSAGKYLGDSYKSFRDAASNLDPTTKDWWPF